MPHKDPDRAIEYSRARYKLLRHKVITVLGGKCMSCGLDDFDVLQIDHIVPIKRPSGERGESLTSYGTKILKDMRYRALFQLLCANCHMKKTMTETRNNFASLRGDKHWNWKGGYKRTLRKIRERYKQRV